MVNLESYMILDYKNANQLAHNNLSVKEILLQDSDNS